MVIGASLGAGCCVSADGDEDEDDSVAVSICSFALLSSARVIGDRNPPHGGHARSPLRACGFCWCRRCWMKRGVSTTNSFLSSFQPREFPVPHLPRWLRYRGCSLAY